MKTLPEVVFGRRNQLQTYGLVLSPSGSESRCFSDYVPYSVESTGGSLFDVYATLTSFPSAFSSSSAAFSIHRSR
jgi:hypothetical protein